MQKKNFAVKCNLFSIIFFAATVLTALAADQPLDEAGKIRPAGEPKAELSVTRHKIVINGVTISYTATAGTLIVRNEKDLPYARMGYFAYTKNDLSDLSLRPITFAYNGGPGSCSVWLHMGALGPERIVTVDAAPTPPPPYKIVGNDSSILDKTDLVMIDPVGTGFSRAIGEAKDKDFWGVDPDIESVARFIRQYITENGRWNSSKYLLGESYGTTRSAGVVDWLQVNAGMVFNGVILVSMATDLELLFDDIPGYHWPSLFALPTFTAVAWYHKRLPDPPAALAPLLDDVRTFALGEYASALAQGNNLPLTARQAVIEKLHRYTGLSLDYLDRADLHVSLAQFANELLRDRRDTVGFLDARFVGVNADPLGKNAEYDPMDAATTAAFCAAFLNYLRRDLKFSPEKTYVLDANVFNDWDYRHKVAGAAMPQPMVNTGVDLAHAMGFNPNLRVLVLQGIYDLGSVLLASEYMVSHLNLRADLRSHIEIRYYDAGHMMYIHEPSLQKFKSDIADFMEQTKKTSGKGR